MKKREVLIKTVNLQKNFKFGSITQEVLKDINIEIYKGDFTVIMGNSGSGKSTLLYTLSGLEQASGGQVQFLGEEISKYSSNKMALFRRKHCGFVFQHNYLDNTMSVMDNVLLCGYLNRKKKGDIVEKAKKEFTNVGIDEMYYKKSPTQLSGGEQQRVGLVRAVINEPEMIFADEPTGALNSSNSELVLQLLSQQSDKGNSVLMVTHDIKSALRGNRVLYLKDGKIVDEINLGRYQLNDDGKRLANLTNFLNELGW